MDGSTLERRTPSWQGVALHFYFNFARLTVTPEGSRDNHSNPGEEPT